MEIVATFIGNWQYMYHQSKIIHLFNVPTVDCASHNFNLPVEHWIKYQNGFSEGLKYVHDLMVRLRTIKHSARLREIVHLGAKTNNHSRCKSKFQLLLRYFQIEYHVRKLEFMNIYIPEPFVRRKLAIDRKYLTSLT